MPGGPGSRPGTADSSRHGAVESRREGPIRRLALATTLLLLPVAHADETIALRGRVVDEKSGEGVAGARVSVSDGRRETTADAEGRFGFVGLAKRSLVLRVSAPGYRSFAQRLALGTASEEFLIPLERERPRVAESVTVTSEAAVPAAEVPAPLARRFEGAEVMALSSVAASDPLRAVQGLPGLAANDEFNAGFAARGHGFGAAGLCIDGVRLEAPFHTIRDINDGYTLTIFNGDVVDSMTLVPGAAPARYGDRVGANLAVRTREGRTDAFHGKASLGAAGAFATLEGPIGGRASWIASARKSYLDYILERVDDDPRLALGYHDLTARLTWRPRPSQTLSLLGLFGRSRYENTEEDPSPHTMEEAAAGTSLLHLSWRAASGTRSLAATAFLLRQTGDNRDTDGFPRYSSDSWQSGLVAEGAWRRGAHRLDGGFEARWVREDAVSRRWGPEAPRVLEDYRLTGWPWGAFLQDTWAAPGGRVTVTLGGRVDHLDTTGETVALPRAALAFAPAEGTRLTAAAGAYAQFPRFAQLAGENGNPDLDAERSRHLALALEQRLPAGLRLRLEAYHQGESRLVFNRELDWRLENGVVVRPSPGAVLLNALSGPSRGLEVTLAAPQAGPFSGFLSYTFAHARREDGSGLAFDADFDQRHTVTAYLRARAGASWLLSTAFRYGSGFPFPGFLREMPQGIFVDAERNRFGPDPYSRWDARAEKRFTRGRVSVSLYLEVANVLDHENERYNEIDSVNPATGRVRLDRDEMLPLIPLFGATVEF
jgi:hypothetical protein